MLFDHKRIEEQVRKKWDETRVCHDIVDWNKGRDERPQKFYLLDGPPYANGSPHVGHMLTITYKDVWARYKYMKGYKSWFQPGFDCHGLPIEKKVEEKFGITSKKDIVNKIGEEKFIDECRKFALKYVDEWRKIFEKMGALRWLLEPYYTLDNSYIESIWWTIKTLFEKGIMVRGKKPIHWCPRCETSISGYEATDEYRDVTDPSIYVKFKIKGEEDTFFLVWTTTPWTLPANVALIVHPEEEYVKVETPEGRLILAKKLLHEVMKKKGWKENEHYRILETFPGKSLEGVKYEPLIECRAQESIKGGNAHRVVLSIPILKSFEASKKQEKKGIVREEESVGHVVTMDVGTGIVHCAPGHGAEDNKIGKHYGLEELSPLDDECKYTGEVEEYQGLFVKEADPLIIERLEREGRLFHQEKITHSYPLCWRCKSPLIFRLSDQWFFRVEPIKQEMLKYVEETRWLPPFMKERMRHWVENEEDWCVSTQRFWGAPIPIWECKKCGHRMAIGGKEELEQKAMNKVELDDLHKHRVDRVKIKCEECGGEMERIPDIINIWVESGVAPWASLGYPHKNRELFEELWRVDLVDESQDQIRGWFHSLLFMGAATFGDRTFETVCVNGWVLDEKGEKMSKSLGNVVTAEEMLEEVGADGARLFYCSNVAPWETQKVGIGPALETHKFFNTLLNTTNYIRMYRVPNPETEPQEKSIEDEWMLSRLSTTIREATRAMEEFRFHHATRMIMDMFQNDFSRWYMKLAKERPPEDEAKGFVIHKVLRETIGMLAPICPFVTDHVYHEFFAERENKRSVHETFYPEPDESRIRKELEQEMEMAMRIVEAVSALRQDHGLRQRWPINRVTLYGSELLERTVNNLGGIIQKMCNTKMVEYKEAELDMLLKPRYDALGPVYGRRVPQVVEALKKADARKIADQLSRKGVARVGEYEITPEMVEVVVSPPEGAPARQVGNGLVEIDPEMDEELKKEAFAREVARAIQVARKKAGLDVKQVINVEIGGPEFLKEYEEFLSRETNSRVSIVENLSLPEKGNVQVLGHEARIGFSE